MTNEQVTYVVAGACALIALVAFVMLILRPAWMSYSRVWERMAAAFLSLYVLFGFYVMYIGGMLNFIATPVYWIKIAALAAALLLEASLAKAGLPLVPWALFRVPTFGRASRLATR